MAATPEAASAAGGRTGVATVPPPPTKPTATVLIGVPNTGKTHGANKRGIKDLNPCDNPLLWGDTPTGDDDRAFGKFASVFISYRQVPFDENEEKLPEILRACILTRIIDQRLPEFIREALGLLFAELPPLTDFDEDAFMSDLRETWLAPGQDDDVVYQRAMAVWKNLCAQTPIPATQIFRTEHMRRAIVQYSVDLGRAIAKRQDVALTGCNTKLGDMRQSVAELSAAGYKIQFLVVGTTQTKVENQLNNLRRFVKEGIYVPQWAVEKKRTEMQKLRRLLKDQAPTVELIINTIDPEESTRKRGGRRAVAGFEYDGDAVYGGLKADSRHTFGESKTKVMSHSTIKETGRKIRREADDDYYHH